MLVPECEEEEEEEAAEEPYDGVSSSSVVLRSIKPAMGNKQTCHNANELATKDFSFKLKAWCEEEEEEEGERDLKERKRTLSSHGYCIFQRANFGIC